MSQLFEPIREWFLGLQPVWQALLAGLFTWSMTAIGAGLVFVTTRVSRRLLDSMLGFSGGVMLAASYWSLLAPAIEIAEQRGTIAWLPATVGLLAGAATLALLDKVLPHLHLNMPPGDAEGIQVSWHRSILLITAITLHNIPEGLAVGVAFGGAWIGGEQAGLAGALTLALGIGLQNLPEGTAVAWPLRGSGLSRTRSFFYGQLSAIVEPIAAAIGCLAVMFAAPLLPYVLAFAAGAMIFVVVEELIPESQQAGHGDLATLSLMLGFAVMMILDVAFG